MIAFSSHSVALTNRLFRLGNQVLLNMKEILVKAREQLNRKPQMWICLLIFTASLFIYLANGRPLSSGDNVPSSLLAFNWLFEHTLNFDAFRDGYLFNKDQLCATCAAVDGTPYYLVEAPNGHLTSTYPIGNAIVSFPLYGLFFIILKLNSAVQSWLSGVPVLIPPVTEVGFEIYRQRYEMLAAAILTAGSVVLFYLCAALKFHPGIALLTAFIFGFATNTWVTSSQALWQHTAANFALLCVMLCLLKANRIVANRATLLLVAGFFCGLIPGCRPTSVLFAIAITLYCFFAYGREVRFFLLGLPSFLLSSGWNFYYFGVSPKNLLVAGYSRFSTTSFTASFYQFTPQQFVQGFAGLLVNPNRGLFVYAPVLLFAIPGLYRVWQLRWKKDEQLLGCLTIAALLIFIQYCFFGIWWGGWCYGPRFLTDILPVLCFLMAYCLRDGLALLQHRRYKLMGIAAAAVFFGLTLFSTGVQVVGAFGFTSWDAIPGTNVPYQAWSLQDTQIQRHANRLFYQLHRPIEKPRQYLRRTHGVIQVVQDANQQPIAEPLTATPGQEILLTARIKNIGKTEWYGYETALGRGEARIEVKFLDSLGAPVEIGATNLLYVSGRPAPKETTKAVGPVRFPAQPGAYQMVLTPILQGLGEFPKYKEQEQVPFRLSVVVANPA